MAEYKYILIFFSRVEKIAQGFPQITALRGFIEYQFQFEFKASKAGAGEATLAKAIKRLRFAPATPTKNSSPSKKCGLPSSWLIDELIIDR